MLRYIVFLGISCAIVYVVTVFFRLGGHLPVKISAPAKLEPVALLAKAHIGAYHKIASVISEVESWALKNNLPCQRSFGEYIDDPRVHEEARLRSFGGCVLDGIQSVTMTMAMPEGFTIRRIEDRKYVRAEFEGAPSIGPIKVYPNVMDYLEEKRLKIDGPVYEIYQVSGEDKAVTQYLFPVAKP